MCLGVIIGVATLLGVAAATGAGSGKMEYRVIHGNVWDGNFQTNLNKAAADGWKFEDSNAFAERYAYSVMSRVKE